MFSSCSVVGFCGSRSLPSSVQPLVASVVSAVLSGSAARLVVGCSVGADSVVLSSVLCAFARVGLLCLWSRRSRCLFPLRRLFCPCSCPGWRLRSLVVRWRAWRPASVTSRRPLGCPCPFPCPPCFTFWRGCPPGLLCAGLLPFLPQVSRLSALLPVCGSSWRAGVCLLRRLLPLSPARVGSWFLGSGSRCGPACLPVAAPRVDEHGQEHLQITYLPGIRSQVKEAIQKTPSRPERSLHPLFGACRNRRGNDRILS